MAARPIVVTAIRVTTDTNSLFEGWSDADYAVSDEEATRAAYLQQLGEALACAYPRATIDVRDAVVYRTEVSIDTNEDNAGDEATCLARLDTEQRVAQDADDWAAIVWETGNFWMAKDEGGE